jgi:hypothetical protein
VGVTTNKGAARQFFGEEVSKTLIGCATGLGARPIRGKAYFEFAKNYQPGDRIYIFGFSRGAAIARMLANDIIECGIPQSIQAQYYRWPEEGEDYLLDIVVKGPREAGRVPIRMLGLWDTVTAFGVPWVKIDPFNILTISGNVEQAIHLVAIDEHRKTFDATLMNQERGNVEEIWFAGAHTNVGGGFEDHKLSDIALNFMINRANEAGLQFLHEARIEFSQDGVDFIGDPPPAEYDVTGEFWKAGRLWLKTTREIRVRGGKPGAMPRIHKSVFERKLFFEQKMSGGGNDPKSGCAYDPPNIRKLNRNYVLEKETSGLTPTLDTLD